MRSQRDITDAAPDGTDRIVYRMVRDPRVVYILDREIQTVDGKDTVGWRSLGKFNFQVVVHMERNAWRNRNLQTWDHDRCLFVTGPRVRKKYEPPRKQHPVPAPQGHGLPARNWKLWRDVIVNGMSRRYAAQKHDVDYSRACQLVNQHTRYVDWQLNHRDDVLADYSRLMTEALRGVEIIERLGCTPYMRMPDGREVHF